MLTDHLGNTRATFVEDGGSALLTQSNHYYPFGLEIAALNYTATPGADYDYLYNGKEKQTFGNLDWYDFGARFYDEATGRWFAVDPLAEDYLTTSAYSYVKNNPILFIDPDGMQLDSADTEQLNRVRAQTQETIKHLQEEIDSGELGEIMIQSNQRAIDELNNVLGNLDKLESSETMYDIRLDSDESYLGYESADNPEDERVTINVQGDGLFLLTQEVLHAAQYENGELDFKKNEDGEWEPGASYDLTDEQYSIGVANLIIGPNNGGSDPREIASHPYYKDLPKQTYTAVSSTNVVRQVEKAGRRGTPMADVLYRFKGWKDAYNKGAEKRN